MTYFRNGQVLFHYFNTLESEGHGSTEKFAAALSEIEHYAFNSHQTASILYRISQYWSRLQGGETRDRLHELICYGIHPWAAQAYAHMGEEADVPFSGIDLAHILWSLGKLRLSLGDEFIQEWQVEAMCALDDGNVGLKACSDMIRAFGKLCIVPEADFLTVWEGATIPLLRKARMDTQSLDRTIWSYASLGLLPGAKWLKTWCGAVNDQMDAIDRKVGNIPIMLWSLAVLDALSPNRALKVLAARLFDEVEGRNLPSAEQSQVALAAQWFDFEAVAFPEENPTISASERRLHQLLADSRRDVTVNNLVTIDEIAHRPDITLERDGRHAFVESDGIFHYTSVGRMNGGTILMTALIAKLRPESVVVRLPYWVSEAWERDWVGNSRTAAHFAHAALSQPAGAYFYDETQGFIPMFERVDMPAPGCQVLKA